jgi:hypothetical protein
MKEEDSRAYTRTLVSAATPEESKPKATTTDLQAVELAMMSIGIQVVRQ